MENDKINITLESWNELSQIINRLLAYVDVMRRFIDTPHVFKKRDLELFSSLDKELPKIKKTLTRVQVKIERSAARKK